MDNGERELNELITSCEKELTALKTAHRHPLGALNFYNRQETLNITLTEEYGAYDALFWVDVTIDTPDVTPPIVQIGWDVPDGFNYVDLFEYSINNSYSVWSYKLFLQSPTITSANLKVSALSSLPIQSISYRSA